MQYFRILLITMMVVCVITTIRAQETVIKLRGTVVDVARSGIEGVSVKVNNSKTVTDKNGFFSIKVTKTNSTTIEVSRIGKKTVRQTVSSQDLLKSLEFVMEDDGKVLETIEVLGLTKVDEINKEAFNVTAVDARKLHNSSMDVGQLLNRVSGVKIRESGGMGSRAALSLNGFSGNQVKVFLDGLPIDNYGSSFQLNNIPINYIDHIEVYKGVVPVWLGGDALGGAINLVKNTNPMSYLDASYSYGSFNTHRVNVNAGIVRENGFTLEVNAYKNYSDNNYRVQVDVVPDMNSGVTVPDRVSRFHDAYQNQMLNLNVGVSNKRWADQLLFGFNWGNNHADVQTGNRMDEVYGARFRDGEVIQPTFQYKVSDVGLKGLDVALRGSFNFGEERSIDTVYRRFNWYGESIPKGNNSWDPGGERTKEFYVYRNNNGNAALNINYTINASNALFLNNTFTSSNRKGENELQPDNPFYSQPKITQKNILGIGLGNTSIKNLDNNIFFKYYYQYVKAYEVDNNVYSTREQDRNFFGYGLASTYHFSTNTQLKFSYEKTYRVPELDELFGNVENLDANPTLKPESSDNLNIGASYAFSLNEKNAFLINGNAIYRYAKDYIRFVLSATNNDNTIRQTAQNQRDVSNLGFDVEARYSYDRKLSVGANVTYQNLRNQTKYEISKTDVSIFYKDRLPNIPYLFGNADLAYTWHNVLLPQSRLDIGYNLFFVHEYFLKWPSAGLLGKEIIPQQLSHDVYVTYSFAQGKYNIGIDGRNLTDALLYDNYMLQKPSRNFSVKFRYILK